MFKINYPLASETWGWEEKAAILRVLARGRYTMGEEVRKFEDEFAKRFASSHAVMVNSGSSANLIALAAWKLRNNIEDGAEIIVPAVSWSTTYFPITQLNMTPVFVDVDENFNINVVEVQAAITASTAAIFAVNILGCPAELERLRSIAHANNIDLLEDNCESLGAMAKIGNDYLYAGTVGTFGTFSFFFSHHLQTMEGGMILTHDKELADYMRSLRAHGWVRDVRTDTLYVQGTYPKWEEKYKFILPGYCMRPLEMSAAAGREQLKKWDKMSLGRLRNANTFLECFGGSEYWIQKGEGSSWFGFGIVLPAKKPRGFVIGKLDQQNVETRPIIAGNFLKQPVMKHIRHRVSGTIINAEELDKQGFYFGNSHRDLREKIKRVADLVHKS